MSRRKLWLAGAAIAAVAAILGSSVLWRARSALNEMRDRVAAEGDLRIAVRPFVPAIPAGLEPIGAPAVFSDAQVFDGRLFLAGPAGVTAYDADGTVAARYRVGLEL